MTVVSRVRIPYGPFGLAWLGRCGLATRVRRVRSVQNDRAVLPRCYLEIRELVELAAVDRVFVADEGERLMREAVESYAFQIEMAASASPSRARRIIVSRAERGDPPDATYGPPETQGL